MRPVLRDLGQILVAWAAYGLVASVISAPVMAQQAIAGVRFEDRLGTLPVEISLAHNGVSTLDTGILGSMYWERTGQAGFGARIRATGPPEAEGSLSSYVSPQFVEANAEFVSDPGQVAQAYGEQLESELRTDFLQMELLAGLVGGALLTGLFRARGPWPSNCASGWQRAGLVAVVVTLGLGGSAAAAVHLFRTWDGNDEISRAYPMPGIPELSFSSAQTLEVARQVRPFIEKNTDRTRERAHQYEAQVKASLRAQFPQHASALTPRDGERIVLAEADPQGSLVGTRARRTMYQVLAENLGQDALALRTISGDVTSNGTVAEEGFVRGEADASPGIPTIAVKGDHDTETSVGQLEDNAVVVPDFETTEIEGLRVVGANDPAFKALFGGLVVNDTGITETELGMMLREEVDPDEPTIVLFHQPSSAAGYIGVDSTSELSPAVGRETIPWDDGVPDLPPGSINIGHLHDASDPWVVWNTDGDLVTWTVVSQLGTSGGVEENPTFNRFSTPFSVPLKTLSVQLQYVNTDSGLQTGYASIDIATDGSATIGDRVDLGLPGGQPIATVADGAR